MPTMHEYHKSIDYNKLAPNYLIQCWNARDAYVRMVEFATLQPGQSVLDAASGSGIVGLLAAEELGGVDNVYFADKSKPMLAEAKKYAKHKYGPDKVSNANFLLIQDICDKDVQQELISRSPGGKGFDMVFAKQFISHFIHKDKGMVLKSLLNLCAPGGQVICDVCPQSPSYRINGLPSDEIQFGYRILELPREINAMDLLDRLRMSYRPTVSSFKQCVGSAEEEQAELEVRRVVGLAGATLVRSRWSFDPKGAESIMPRLQTQGRGSESDLEATDKARRAWLGNEMRKDKTEGVLEQSRKAGFLVPLSIDVVVRMA